MLCILYERSVPILFWSGSCSISITHVQQLSPVLRAVCLLYGIGSNQKARRPTEHQTAHQLLNNGFSKNGHVGKLSGNKLWKSNNNYMINPNRPNSARKQMLPNRPLLNRVRQRPSPYVDRLICDFLPLFFRKLFVFVPFSPSLSCSVEQQGKLYWPLPFSQSYKLL